MIKGVYSCLSEGIISTHMRAFFFWGGGSPQVASCNICFYNNTSCMVIIMMPQMTMGAYGGEGCSCFHEKCNLQIVRLCSSSPVSVSGSLCIFHLSPSPPLSLSVFVQFSLRNRTITPFVMFKLIRILFHFSKRT